MGLPSLFRERALPEQQIRESLDERIAVVRGPVWLGLALVTLAIIGLIAWAAATDVETNVKGSGAVSSAPPPDTIQSPVTGTLVTAPPPPGTPVQAGETIGRVTPAGRRAVTLTAPAAGTVVGASAPAPGALIRAGQTLAQVAPADATRRAYLYVPVADGARLRAGQTVLVTPAGPEQQQDSLIHGSVLSVEAAPATPAQLQRVLGPALAPRLINGSPVVQVVATLRHRSLVLGTPLSGRIVISKSSLLRIGL